MTKTRLSNELDKFHISFYLTVEVCMFPSIRATIQLTHLFAFGSESHLFTNSREMTELILKIQNEVKET